MATFEMPNFKDSDGNIGLFVDSTARGSIEEKSGVITLNSGWNFDPGVSNTIRRVGNIAWISSYIYNSNALTANTTYEIGTIPTGFIPSKSYKFPIYEGAGGSGLRGVAEIKSDGKLMYRSLDGGRYVIYTTIIYPLS